MSDFGTFSLADIAQQAQQTQMQRQAMQQREQQMALQQRSAALDERKFFAQLDEQQREQVEAAVKDLSAAVQWASTPEQWAVVQQHYSQYDPQLSQVPFDQREQALVRLGQMGEYLKLTEPKIQSIEQGGGLYSVQPRSGQVTELVRPNPGDAEPFTPVQDEERKSVGGRNFVKRGGQWFEETGGSNAAGTFQP